jgi:hypothetical protein
MADNLTWQQARDKAGQHDPASLVAQVDAWFELMPLYQWASLAHADLKKAIEERAKALGKPFTIDHAMRALGELGGEVKALGEWLEGQSFAGASRLKAAVEAHLASGAPTTTAAPAAAPAPVPVPVPVPVKEAPKPKEEPKKEEPKKEEAKAKEEPKKEEPKKEEPKKEEAKAATSSEKPKDEPKKDAPASDEKKPA